MYPHHRQTSHRNTISGINFLYTQFLFLNSYQYTITIATTNSLTKIVNCNINDLAKYNKKKWRYYPLIFKR